MFGESTLGQNFPKVVSFHFKRPLMTLGPWSFSVFIGLLGPCHKLWCFYQAAAAPRPSGGRLSDSCSRIRVILGPWFLGHHIALLGGCRPQTPVALSLQSCPLLKNERFQLSNSPFWPNQFLFLCPLSLFLGPWSLVLKFVRPWSDFVGHVAHILLKLHPAKYTLVTKNVHGIPHK